MWFVAEGVAEGEDVGEAAAGGDVRITGIRGQLPLGTSSPGICSWTAATTRRWYRQAPESDMPGGRTGMIPRGDGGGIPADADEGAVAGADDGAVAGADDGADDGAHEGAVAGADDGAVAGAHEGAVAGADDGAVAGADDGAVAGADDGAVAGADDGAGEVVPPGPDDGDACPVTAMASMGP